MNSKSSVLFLFVNIVWLTNGERVVTDWEQLSQGVPLDYSYNETRTSSTGVISVPGCPKSNDGYPWVLYGGNKNPRCYLVGMSFPCPVQTKLHMKPNSPFGVCKFHSADCEPDGKLQPPRPPNSRYSFCIKKGVKCQELVFDNVENRVHELYKKESRHGSTFPGDPCPSSDEWLQPDSYGGVKCAPRKCPKGLTLLTRESDKPFQKQGTDPPCCFSVGSGTVFISPNSCPPKQYYSRIMKRCNQRIEYSGFL